MSQTAWVTIKAVRGSAPRAAGTVMQVWPDPQATPVPWSGGTARAGISGTIGGGALEAEAIGLALAALEAGTERDVTLSLGPGLGQCCGGAVTLSIQFTPPISDENRTHLWIWGAGHVGRAIVDVIAPLEQFAVTWVDVDQSRFPSKVPDSVTIVPVAAPEQLLARAPSNAHHIVLTYSHEIDLALCHAGLSHRFASFGVIGSKTKWARFRTRLISLGHSEAAIAQISCPIGDPSLGKHPQAIAVGVAARLLSLESAVG